MSDSFTRRYRLVLKKDFVAFAIRCLQDLMPGTPYQHNWHIDLIAAWLEACMRGDANRLIINLPPRHLKSLLISVIFPAWLLGHNPSAKIICASYGQDLADKHAGDFRILVNAGWYKALFPHTSLVKNSINEMVTTKNGYRYSTSVGGPLTGRGADYIIIDDPLKPDEALSDTQRKAVNEWYDGNAITRLDNKAAGRIIVVMQRLHEDDLSGYLVDKGGWKVVSFPAIAEQDEEHVVPTKIGEYRVKRCTGNILHPARESQETLASIRLSMGEYNFMSQYQQNPVPKEGILVKAAWFKYYEPGERPAKFSSIVQSWDTANKTTELSDFSVCTTWGIKNKHYYLLDVFRQRLAYPDLKRAVREQRQLYNADNVLIEDKASGTQLIQELVSEGMSCITGYEPPPQRDKVMRLNSQTATIANGFVHLPQEAHWLADYVREITGFPGGKHDDQVDSTTQFLAWAKISRVGENIIEYYELMQKQREEEQRR